MTSGRVRCQHPAQVVLAAALRVLLRGQVDRSEVVADPDVTLGAVRRHLPERVLQEPGHVSVGRSSTLGSQVGHRAVRWAWPNVSRPLTPQVSGGTAGHRLPHRRAGAYAVRSARRSGAHRSSDRSHAAAVPPGHIIIVDRTRHAVAAHHDHHPTSIRPPCFAGFGVLVATPGVDERARAGRTLMITQLFLVALGASVGGYWCCLLPMITTLTARASVPASTLTITMSPGCSRAGRYSPPEEDSWQRSMT